MVHQLSERDTKVIWHPYSAQKYVSDPIPIVRGHGAWLVEENGREMIDAISSWWVTVHGHAHPYIAQKIYEQALELEQVIFTGFTHRPAVELAERLLTLLPGDNHYAKIFYSDNGSTAVEVALKMALQYWWNREEKHRTRILALTGSYHGDTFGAMSVSERGLFTLAFQDRLFEVMFADLPEPGNPLIIRGYDAADTPQLLRECACLIYEPLVQGAGGMLMHSPAALNSLLDICRQHDVLCIADEVMTGFGRTGNLFASAACELLPDLICLSKGLTGGTMALGVTVCTTQVHEAFVQDDRKKTFFHGHSYTANPIACAAGLASLDLFRQEKTMDKVADITVWNKRFCERLQNDRSAKKIRGLRQTGTLVAFEINHDTEGYTSQIRDVVTRLGLEKNVYLRPLGNTLYLMPPYCITHDEMEQVFDSVLHILQQL